MPDWNIVNQNLGGIGQALGDYARGRQKFHDEQIQMQNKFQAELEQYKQKTIFDRQQQQEQFKQFQQAYPELFGGQAQPVQQPNPQAVMSLPQGGQGDMQGNPVASFAPSSFAQANSPSAPEGFAPNPNFAFQVASGGMKGAEPFVKKTDNTVALQEKQDQFNQREWDKIVKETNPLNASPRTALGKSAVATYNANRALKTLDNPVVTNQEAGNVMADIASIYQGGAPTQFGMSHQEYSSVKQKLAAALQFIQGKPTDALPDAVKQRLITVLNDMKNTNREVARQQLTQTEKAKAKIIAAFPDEWDSLKNEILSDEYSGLGNSQQSSQITPEQARAILKQRGVKGY